MQSVSLTFFLLCWPLLSNRYANRNDAVSGEAHLLHTLAAT
jgi:hypothetical protein